jgi:hypothetical protein
VLPLRRRHVAPSHATLPSADTMRSWYRLDLYYCAGRVYQLIFQVGWIWDVCLPPGNSSTHPTHPTLPKTLFPPMGKLCSHLWDVPPVPKKSRVNWILTRFGKQSVQVARVSRNVRHNVRGIDPPLAPLALRRKQYFPGRTYLGNDAVILPRAHGAKA